MPPETRPVWQTKTFWVGVLAVAMAVVEALFASDDGMRPVGEAVRALFIGSASEKFYGGLGAIALRLGLLKQTAQTRALLGLLVSKGDPPKP